MTMTGGWSCARMTALAGRVGVSRPTVYKEFGSRDEVGRALGGRSRAAAALG
jgi:AcrR family transcriptional regulator